MTTALLATTLPGPLAAVAALGHCDVPYLSAFGRTAGILGILGYLLDARMLHQEGKAAAWTALLAAVCVASTLILSLTLQSAKDYPVLGFAFLTLVMGLCMLTHQKVKGHDRRAPAEVPVTFTSPAAAHAQQSRPGNTHGS